MADDDAGPVNTQGESDPIAQAGSMPDSATVNATQIDTQAPDAGQVQTQAPQSGPTVLIPQKRGGLAGIVDEFRDAIAGTHGRGVYINPDTGERHEVTPYLSHGQQWRKIASEALTGATAGFAAGHGAGNMAKAPLAGVQAQMQAHQQQVQNQDQQAEQDYSREKQAKLAKANSQLLALETAKNQFALTRMGVQAGQEDIKFGQEQEDREKALGSADLGIYADHKALADAMPKVNPDFWKNHFDDNSVRAIPVYDADGTRKGVHFYQRQPGIGDQPVAQGTQIPIFQPAVKPGDRPTYKMVTLAGSHTENEVDAYVNSQTAKMQQWEQAQQKSEFEQSETEKNESEVPKNKAETANAYAEAGEHRAQTDALNAATNPEQLQAMSQGLVEGTIDPSQLSKRSKDYDAKLAAANAYSIKTTGKPFDIAKASADYKYATQKSTTDTLNYLNALTGRDNASGNLAKVVQMSKQVGNTTFPPVNDVAQWAKLEAGNANVAAYHAALLEVSDQIAKILQGGGTGTSDAKIKQAGEILNSRFNPAQIAAVANQTLRPLLANRKQEMIGDNRYLQRWHPQSSGAPAGATAEVHNQQGQLIGHVVNGAFKPLGAQ